MDKNIKIAVVGLGYVGLPLAVEFGRIYDVIGFDIDINRLESLRRGEDVTRETSAESLAAAENLKFSSSPESLRDRDVFIVTAPTPVNEHNQPDLQPLLSATRTVGKVMKKGAVVIYESTVYPGCTEEKCVPVLEKFSDLKYNDGFFCGYSPERINPGDREHTLKNIVKITSGSTVEIADMVDELYNSILSCGTHRAPSIKVAETAKVIENTQRDINIAFVNELAKICHLMDIDTNDVLAAARTKWNFLDFRPGLVGGHCIGVDPYYLTHKTQELGYLPEVILAGRRINDGMGKYIASEIIKLMSRKGSRISGAKILQLGITFKENCPDIRNSKAADVARGLAEFGCLVKVCDPLADPVEVRRQYGFDSVKMVSESEIADYDAVILAVSHRDFAQLDLAGKRSDRCVIYDIKGFLPRGVADGRL